MSEPQDPWLTVAEVAKRLRMTPGGLRKWRFEGQGPRSVKNGRATLYRESAVAEYERAMEDAAAKTYQVAS